MIRRRVTRARPLVVHVTTTDMSLDWLLGPQLRAFADASYEAEGATVVADEAALLGAADLLVAVTEKRTVEDIELFAEALDAFASGEEVDL